MNVEERYEILSKEASSSIEFCDKIDFIKANIDNNIESLMSKYKEKEEYLENFKKAVKVVQRITDKRNEVKEYIRKTVEQSLSVVLGSTMYNLDIIDGDRGENKFTDIQFISTITGKPRKVGTAVKQLTSLIFMISLLEISGSSKVLALDEYLGGASEETAKRLSSILVNLAKDYDFQIFIVNHVKEISDNEEFIRIYLEKENDKEGLKIAKIEKGDMEYENVI